MEMFTSIWEFWGVGFGIFFACIVVLLLVTQLIYFSYLWINDKQKTTTNFLIKKVIKDPFIEKGINDGGDWFFGLFVLFFFGVVFSLLWPFILPILIVVGLAYSLRGFVRMKKKINKVVDKIKDIGTDE